MTKKRAFVKYTKQGRLIPGSLIVTTRGGYPTDGLYVEVPTNICCDTDISGTITSSPKGWVRYTKKGAIVPGSLIVSESHPRDGVWKEVYIDICCASSLPFSPIIIGSQTWADRNLDVTVFSNGDSIPEATSALEFGSATGPMWAYAYYDSNYSWMGKMYNMYAIRDPRGLAPQGWHIPTVADWLTLGTTLGPTAGGEMKQAGTTYWSAPNTGATNSSGFTALPTELSTAVGDWQNVSDQNGFYIASDSVVDGNDLFFLFYTNDALTNLTNISSSQNTNATAVRVIKD